MAKQLKIRAVTIKLTENEIREIKKLSDKMLFGGNVSLTIRAIITLFLKNGVKIQKA